jgi:signal transduction histidine kinase
MSPLTLDQVQLQTLSQLLAAGGHHEVSELLKASLERLVAFWPAHAGALLYLSPHGEVVRLEHGPLDQEARTLIEQARTSFARRDDGSEPAVGYYSLEGGYDLLELSLQSHNEGVGLVHLVVNADADPASDKSVSTMPVKPDEDLLILLVRSIGGEADKLAALQRAERDLRELRLLYEVGQSLAINLDLSSLLNDIKQRAPRVVGAERCSIFILDEEKHELVLEITDQEREFRMPADRGIAGWVATHGIPQIVSDVEQDARWYDVIARESEFTNRSLVCVPIRVNDRVIGVMQLLNKRNGETFNDQDVQLLMTLAAQAGIAIENARLYRKLREERDRLLAKEAQVRNTIARDLHDGPTQRLTAVMMNIEFIKKLLVAMPERVSGELDTLSDLVNKTITDIRTFLFELRPLGLETQGLLSTLQQYVARWQDPSGEGVRLRLQAPANVPRLSAEVEAAIFIIIQEAINNARKHSQAAEIVIYLYVEEAHLVASVRDRGKGFNVELMEANAAERGSMGLLNMKERATLIGAEFRIRSEPGNGTIVELRVPIA